MRQSKQRTSPTPTPQKQQQKQSASGSVFKPVTIVAAAVHIRLPGGSLIEVPAGNDGALRAIVGQLVCDQRHC